MQRVHGHECHSLLTTGLCSQEACDVQCLIPVIVISGCTFAAQQKNIIKETRKNSSAVVYP